MCIASSGNPCMNALLDLRPGGTLRDAQIIVSLQADPGFWRNTKVLAKTQRRISRYGASAVDDAADAPGWYECFQRTCDDV